MPFLDGPLPKGREKGVPFLYRIRFFFSIWSIRIRIRIWTHYSLPHARHLVSHGKSFRNTKEWTALYNLRLHLFQKMLEFIRSGETINKRTRPMELLRCYPAGGRHGEVATTESLVPHNPGLNNNRQGRQGSRRIGLNFLEAIYGLQWVSTFFSIISIPY